MRFILMGLVVLAFGCGDGSKEGPENRNKIPEDFEYKDMDDAASRMHVRCPQGNCSKAVGAMILSDADGTKTVLYRCTSFVINDHQVMTNSHCLPDAAKFRNNCSKSIRFVFGEDENREIFSCKNIVRHSDHDGSIVDYAILEVDRKITITPMQLDTNNPIAHQEQISIYSLDHTTNYTDDTLISTFDEKSCTTAAKSLESDNYTGERSPRVTYVGCPTINGNSGAPILNQQGKVIGLHQASYKPKVTSRYSNHFANLMGVQTTQIPTFGMGTNLSCFCSVNGSYTNQCQNKPANCSQISNGSKTTFKKNRLQQYIQNSVFDPWANNLQDIKLSYNNWTSEKDYVEYFAKLNNKWCALKIGIDQRYEIISAELKDPNCHL